jgi:VWFA-related protein
MPQRRALTDLLPLLCAACLVALATAAAGASAAQTDASAGDLFLDQVTVEVVNVDVTVTDPSGRPITGLTAEDFVLYQDGEPQEITNFFAFRDGRLRLDREPDTTLPAAEWPEERMVRRVVFLFDNNSLEKRDRRRAIEELERFVLEQFDGTYEWAVVAYRDELQLLQPFTRDKTTVLGALSRVDKLPIPVRRRHASDASILEDAPIVSRQETRRGRRGIDQMTLDLTNRDFELRERMSDGLQQFDHTAAALVQTMRAYMGLDGRKSLVLVTGAIATLPGGAQLIGHGLPTMGGSERLDPMVAVMHGELLERYKAIIQIANAAGFSIYPVSSDALMESKSSYLDVARKATLAYSPGFTDSPADVDVETASRTMAAGTGGRFYSTASFYNAFDDIDDRTANSYVLGFATDHLPESGYHRIRVEVKRPGLQVFHRQGYLHLTREQQIAEELATPLTFPKDRGDFEVQLEITEPERSRRKVDVTVAGLVPMSQITLIPRGDRLIGRVHVYIAVYDLQGNIVSLVRELQDVDVEAAKMAAAPDGVPARIGLRLNGLPQGSYTVSLTLIDDVTNRFGTSLQAVSL